MDEKKRERSKLINTLNIPMYAGALIACEHKATFYKKLWGYTFYTVDDFITFRIDDVKPQFVIVGKIGVSNNEELIKGFIEVMNFLGYKVDLQGIFSIFNSKYEIMKKGKKKRYGARKL